MNIAIFNNKTKQFLNHLIPNRYARIGLAAFLFITLVFCYYLTTYISTDDAYIEGHITPISSKIPGYVQNVYVQDNQIVKQGDLLMQIDPIDYEIQLAKAKANLEAITAQHKIALNNFKRALISVPSNLSSAEAAHQSALAAYEDAVIVLKRTEELFKTATKTQKDLDDATKGEKVSKAQLDEAKAKLKASSPVQQELAASEANVEQLNAQVKQAEADLSQASTNLENTKIYAPQDGKITNKQVEIGAYLQPGQSTLSLVGNDFWVTANFKETQLAQIAIGASVEISIDAFPDLTLSGKVESIQAGTGSRLSLFPAQNATGNFVKVVQRIPVKIVFDKPIDTKLCLAAGMSVIPKVKTR